MKCTQTQVTATSSQPVDEVRSRKDKRVVDLISDAIWCAVFGEPDAITNGYAKFHGRSHDAVICVFDAAGNVIETHEQAGRFSRVLTANCEGQELNGD
jgi:hypothetical protein